MKALVVCSSLDLRYPFSSTPAWWQLLKGLSEVGVDVLATPYQGYAIESPWWRAYDNPCRREGDLFKRTRDMIRGLRRSGGEAKDGPSVGEGLMDKLVRRFANTLIRPGWQRHLTSILETEADIDSIIILNVPLNHFKGLPTHIRQRYDLPIIYYDGDVPASLPAFQGFASGFKIYHGADLTEYDGFISNSKGGAEELRRMGARNVDVLYYGVDPGVFGRLDVDQDIDVFFYGHGYEYRRDWIDGMLTEPSRRIRDARFAVRATDMNIDLGSTERLPYMSLSKLREYSCRSRINLNITRDAHASVYGSSTCRPFELAAMGCCIVSNPVEGMQEWFEVGKEILMVNDINDVVDTYRWLLRDDVQRRRMGRAARERVLREHTCQHRANQLVRMLSSFVDRRD